MSAEPTKATDYSLAGAAKGNDTAVADGVPVNDGYQGTQAHKCCGGCCDMRRAVIIVNIVNACLLAMGLMSFGYISKYDGGDLDDDEVEEAFTSLDAGMPVLIAITAIKLVITLLGIYGAYSYNILLVGICGVSYALEAALALITLNLGSLVYSGFFAYPHYFFVQEARSGVMTKENYENVKYSCCCV